MSETPAKQGADDDLAVQAFLYYSGELDQIEATAFERLLGEQEEARDALVEVVRMTIPLVGAVPSPDPAYRQAVRNRLQAGWWNWLLGSRARRGHPLLWALTGAAAALLLFTLWPWDSAAADSNLASQSILGIILNEPIAQEPADEDVGETAFIWAELNNTDHLERAIADEQKRRSRAEDRRQVRGPRRGAVADPGGNH
jgi:hypothetical protein